MTDTEKKERFVRGVRARAWSIACHHSYGQTVEESTGFNLLLLEMQRDEIELSSETVGAAHQTYQAVREILANSPETSPRDAFALTVEGRQW